MRRLLDIARDLLSCRTLLPNGRGDEDAISLIWPMVPANHLIAATVSPELAWMAANLRPISSVALAVWSGQRLYLGSDNGEAPPRVPRACRLDRGVKGQKIGLAGDLIDQFDHVADLLGAARQAPDRPVCALRLLTAFCAILADSVTWRAISATELDSSSVAAATVRTLADASSVAAATVVARRLVSPAVAVIEVAVDCSCEDATVTEPSSAAVSVPNLPASSLTRIARAAR